jgi:2-haloacid dehalogenase
MAALPLPLRSRLRKRIRRKRAPQYFAKDNRGQVRALFLGTLRVGEEKEIVKDRMIHRREVLQGSCHPTSPARPAAIDVAVFDLGGVLIDWNPRYLYRKLFDDDVAMERFLAEVCSPEWNERQDAGRLWCEAVAELAARHPDQASMISAYHQRWPEMVGGAIPETVELLEELKGQGLRLYALTNWSHETFHVARSRFAFLDLFEGIVVSGEERLIKPDPAIFHRLLTRYSIVPQRAVYIDDSARNVSAAAGVGFHALRFVDGRQLRQDLIALGLPIHNIEAIGEASD